jgi:hypothetical protein
MQVENLTERIEIWKKVVDVQQHFNDLEMRIRNFAVTILGALFGAAGLALSRDIKIDVGGVDFPLGLFFLLAALVTWSAFWFMDRHWYHRLLYGAVKHGMKVENSIKMAVPEIALTQSIGEESPIQLRAWKIRSPAKINIFYGVGALAVIIAIVALSLTANLTQEEAIPEPADAAIGVTGK